MTASYPVNIKSFGAEHVDGDYIPASDANQVRAEIVAVETALGQALPLAAATSLNTEVLTSNRTLTDADKAIQSYSSSTSREISLPAVASTNHAFIIINRSSQVFSVKDAGGTSIASLAGGNALTLISDGIAWKVSGSAGSSSAGRPLLTANRSYYVASTGSDSNDGLTAGRPFLTLQKAAEAACNLDTGGYSITVNVAAGTYTAGVSVNKALVGGGSLVFLGDTNTPGNVVISVSNADCFIASNFGTVLSVKGFKLITSGSGHGMHAYYGGVISVEGRMDFGACATRHMTAEQGGQIICWAISYNISGASACHMYATGPGSLIMAQSNTVSLTGSPAFSTAFAVASSLACISGSGCTYSGSTGTAARYACLMNGVIQTSGSGANYYPGTLAGSTATGGQYG